MTSKKAFTLDPESIPWQKLSVWQARWIQSTIDFQKEFNCVLPQNSFTIIVCKSILSKVQ